jgi:hypothetical protein
MISPPLSGAHALVDSEYTREGEHPAQVVLRTRSVDYIIVSQL